MDLNRFPRSIPAAFLLTAFVLLVLSVGPQVSAFSNNQASSGAPFASGPRSAAGAALSAGSQYDIGLALLARGAQGFAGQYSTPQNVVGPRALNAAAGARLESALPAATAAGPLGFAEEQGSSAQALAAWAARYQGEADALAAAGGADAQSLAAWAARYQGQADALSLGAAGGQKALEDWAKQVRDAYYLAE